jgi:hypothetical protein
MTMGVLFWVIMLIWLIFGIFTYWPAAGGPPYPLGGHIILWILLALLGWKVFGPALHG